MSTAPAATNGLNGPRAEWIRWALGILFAGAVGFAGMVIAIQTTQATTDVKIEFLRGTVIDLKDEVKSLRSDFNQESREWRSSKHGAP